MFFRAFIIYDSVPNKDDAFVKRFRGYEGEVYDGTGTGKALVKQYLELDREKERPIIEACEDKSDWEGYTTVGIKKNTKNNIEDFRDGILILDDMGSKLNKQKNLFYKLKTS